MRIEANRALCDSNGNCVRAAPELLGLDADDLVEVLTPEFGEAQRTAAEAAVRSCPKNALRLVE